MRLIDLNPSFVGHGGEGVSDAAGNPIPRREKIGVSFDCPCGCASPTFIAFTNPLDGGPPYSTHHPTWLRSGDTFETLTLSPSIQRRTPCTWHGFVVNGEIIHA